MVEVCRENQSPSSFVKVMMAEVVAPKYLVKHHRMIQDDYLLFGLSQIQPKTRPMHYTDPLLCFIIKAVTLGLQTPCAHS